ncbi:MAG: Rne/Rng family ribonuclease [Terriglobia bacterium]
MSKELFIASSPHETKVAVLEDDQLVEVYYERDVDVGVVGSIYKGRVSRVLPGMQSAFVNIGLDRDAFLYVSDFFEDEEEYDKVFTEAETRATRFVEGAQVGPGEIPASESGPTVAAAPAPEIVESAAPPATLAAAADATVAPVAPVGAPSVPAKPAGEPAEGRRYDPRARRPRRRGREFGERKFAPKSESRDRVTEHPEHTAPHTFEILPGESLAKHRAAAPSAPPEEPSTAEPIGPEAHPESTASGEIEALPVASATVETATEPLTPEASSLSPEPVPVPEVAASAASTTEAAAQAVAEPPPYSDTSVTETSAEAPALAEPAAATEVETAPANEVQSPSEPAVTPDVETAQAAEPAPPVAEGLEAPAPPEPAERAEASAPAEEPGAPVGEREFWPELEPPTLTPETEEFAEDASVLSAGTVPQEPAAQPAGRAPATPAETPVEQKYTLREPYQRPRIAPRRRRGRRGMGQPAAPPERHEPSRPGNHQPVQISDLLKEGQEILVQIAKEPLGTKGARITSHIALPGRYLVYMPTINHIGVSRKITSEEERLRLRNIILENKGSLTGGFIVRTAGGGRSEEEFKTDLKFLSTLWSDIRAKAERAKAPALLHRDLDLVQRILRDMLSPDFKTVRVDSEVEYERSVEFVNRCQPSLVGRVKLYTRDTPMFEEFGIQAEVDKALKPKVWLKSGGYIVINQTEALVAIDVNTGKYVGKTNRLEDTIVKTNIDAVNEIVRQIRLRDLGGILVIDFIDMDERRNRMKVVQALEEALRRDRAPTKILSFNDFGLVALTRKRVKQSLERTLCQPCTYCSGSGWIKSLASVCYEIVAEVKKMAKQIEGDTITLRVNPDVAQALKSRQGALVSELESLTSKDVIIKSDPTVHQERFEIY